MAPVDWVEEFYSVTGRLWGPALAKIDDVDRLRASLVDRVAPEATDVLELGCGYGSTALAVAASGRRVDGSWAST